MSTLITIGCSFIQGVGIWYEDEEPITSDNRRAHQEKYFKQHYSKQLNYSIGSILQEELGYEDFINFGISGTSISNQNRIWVENKIEIEGDVLVLLFGTYPTRMGQYVKGKIGDVDLLDSFWSYPYHGDETKGRTPKEIEFDLHLDFIYNIKLFKNYCKSRGWKFEYSFIDDTFSKAYETQIGNYFPNPFKDFEQTLHPNEKCHLSPHPNKLGYQKISNNFINWIKENKKDWYKFEKPISKKKGYHLYRYLENGNQLIHNQIRF